MLPIKENNFDSREKKGGCNGFQLHSGDFLLSAGSVIFNEALEKSCGK